MSQTHKVLYVVLPMIAAVLANFPIFLLTRDRNARRCPSAPNMYVAAAIWVILFGFLGYALCLAITHSANKIAAAAIIVLLLYALIYPYLTSGLQQPKIERAQFWTTICLILSFTTTIVVEINTGHKHRWLDWPVLYLLPVLAWTSYVNLLNSGVCGYYSVGAL